MRIRSSSKRSFIRLAILLSCLSTFLYFCFRDSQEIERYLCHEGPAKPPLDLSHSERSRLSAADAPGNPHEPFVAEHPTIRGLDFRNVSTGKLVDRVLILTPLRDAAAHLDIHFQLLLNLTYPHQHIDLAFLVGDCKDDTLSVLHDQLDRLQDEDNPLRFKSAMVVKKDFGDSLGQSVEERHSFKAQGTRRRMIGRSRNYLLYAAMKPVHDWIYWRDVDIVENPPTILEDFMKHDKDVLVPNIWFHRYDENGKDIEGRYDYNSWQESFIGRWKRKRLDKDVILAEGYKEYNMHRRTLNWMGDRHKDKDRIVPLDGIGGVNILVKAEVHRSGINFPAYAFENQADTEGFAAMAKRAGFGVFGLPNYIVWHIDTEEKEGNLKGRPKDKEADET